MHRIKCLIVVGAAAVTVAVVVTLVVLLSGNDRHEDELLRTTDAGPIRGTKIHSNFADFYAFFSIPYAKPPINERRFMSPEPAEAWAGVHDGTAEGPVCIQGGTSNDMSEDCLTLSVYTNDIGSTNRPVLVWIHGGALTMGSARLDSQGPHFLMRHDLIVVTVQFRLSIFGFLNLEINDAPGNMGLADVIEALKWVKKNIKYFGGDPDNVTVGGLSSGAIMAHALMLSPRAEGLLHKVLIQSGTALSYRFYHYDNQEPITKTKDILNMNNVSNAALLAHLKTLTGQELLSIISEIQAQYPTGYAVYFPYAISKDYFGIIPYHPIELIRNNSYTHLPMFIGYTSDEGIRLEEYMDRLDFVNDNFQIVVPTDLYSIDDMSYEKNETARIIKEFYFGDGDVSRETFPEYAKLCMDSWYSHITDYIIRLQTTLGYNASIYYFVFAVDGAYNLKRLNNIQSPGASHSDDLGYMIYLGELANIVPDDDFSDLVRQRLVKLISNFIIDSDPTPELDELTPVKWEPVERSAVKYMLINRTDTLLEDPYRDRVRFWQSLYGWEL